MASALKQIRWPIGLFGFIVGVAVSVFILGALEVQALGRFEPAWGGPSASLHLWASLAAFTGVLAAVPFALSATAQRRYPGFGRSVCLGAGAAGVSILLGFALASGGHSVAPAFVALFLLATLAPRAVPAMAVHQRQGAAS